MTKRYSYIDTEPEFIKIVMDGEEYYQLPKWMDYEEVVAHMNLALNDMRDEIRLAISNTKTKEELIEWLTGL